MSKTVSINGNTYAVEQNENEVSLKRYDEKSKIQVNLHFPADKRDDSAIVDALSNMYIEQHTDNSPSNDRSECMPW